MNSKLKGKVRLALFITLLVLFSALLGVGLGISEGPHKSQAQRDCEYTDRLIKKASQ